MRDFQFEYWHEFDRNVPNHGNYAVLEIYTVHCDVDAELVNRPSRACVNARGSMPDEVLVPVVTSCILKGDDYEPDRECIDEMSSVLSSMSVSPSRKARSLAWRSLADAGNAIVRTRRASIAARVPIPLNIGRVPLLLSLHAGQKSFAGGRMLYYNT